MIAIAITVATLVNLLIAGAIEMVWRRRREARHARSWSAAFVLTGLAWAILAWTYAMSMQGDPAGAAATLCWLAAGLLFVHGLRQRAGRVDRAPVLAAIWIAVAFGIALLLDVARVSPTVVHSGVPMLAALGLSFAAIAVGPRGRRWLGIDGAAMALLGLLAAAQLALAWTWLIDAGLARFAIAIAPLAALPAYVAIGLTAMLLLNDDLTAALDRLARTDPLTRVWNRRGFDEGAAMLLARLQQSPGRLAAVAIADIDSFKSINDRFGHSAGDIALVRFARLLGSAVQKGDLLARLGGEEFALLAIGVDGPGLVERVERARALVALADDGALPVPVTASFGVAQLNSHSLSLRDALERADHALYRAKVAGKNRTILADEAARESAPRG